jgi:2-phospho-L-lactate guanylyltransferase
VNAISAWAVVPVKPFHAAKQRLSSVLHAAERMKLARLMVEDVLSAVAASRDRLSGLIVLTADDTAAALARDYGAVVLRDDFPAGLNAALALAVTRLSSQSDAAMLVLPADLPHVSPEAIGRMIDLLDKPRSVALLAASHDGGTNLLACRPANVISPSFGPSSLELHRQAAQRAGILPRMLACPALGQDIDRPDDLAAFLSLGTATRTHAFLSRLHITERLGAGTSISL